jgi:hypothetical protein
LVNEVVEEFLDKDRGVRFTRMDSGRDEELIGVVSDVDERNL